MVLAGAMVLSLLGAVSVSRPVVASEGITFPEYYPEEALIIDEEEVMQAKIDALLAAMTQEEKFSFLGGHGTGLQGNAGFLPGVARLGVPETKMYDGPAGVLSLYDTTNPPIEQMLAATWDEELAYDYGKIHGSENKAIGGNMQLGDQIDITRNPYFGRAKDQMGEDPYLLSNLAAAETKGIQDQNVIAVLKHFAAFAQDANPSTNTNVVVSEQALHELYLPAFESAVKAGATGIMSSYNMINGTFASANSYLQVDVLRNLWGYDGFTITDWGGNDGFTLNKGTDIEMPNISGNSQEAAEEKIAAGEITQEDVDTAVRRVLTAYGRTGYLGLVTLDEEGNCLEEEGRTESIKLPENKEMLEEVREENSLIARQVAKEGAVLLKNEEALPIAEGESAAVIGLNGTYLISGIGGERSYGTIAKMVSPADALKEILGEDKVDAQVAMDIVGEAVPAEYLYTSAEGEDHGVVRTYGIAGDEGTSADVQGQMWMFGRQVAKAMGEHEIGEDTGIVDETIFFTTGTVDGKPNKTWKNENADEGTANAFPVETGACYTWTTYLQAPEDGTYVLSMEGIGGSISAKLEVGEETVSFGLANINQGTQWPADSNICTPTGMDIVSKEIELSAGERYKLSVTADASLAEKDLQLCFAMITPSQRAASYEAALQAAAQEDISLVFVSKHNNSPAVAVEESSLALDGASEKLILDVAEAAHSAGHKVVVVLNNDTAVTMGNWIESVDAVLEMYFPGQEGSIATAEVLTGIKNPSGKLAYAIPKEDTDTMVTCSQDALDRQDVPEEGDPIAESKYNQEVMMGRFSSVEEAKAALGENRTNHSAYYDEGIFTGYRWYDALEVEPLYDFGYGLSYTTFTYSDLSVEEAVAEGEQAGFDVTFTVTNTGSVAGTEIAQVYLGEGEVPEGVQMAKLQLAGYEKVKDLAPGESRIVTVHVGERSLSYWNTDSEGISNERGGIDKWTLCTGSRMLYVGEASNSLLLEAEVTI